MSIGYKFRVALAGLTALAMMGGVMAADPADAGKKKKKKAKAKSAKVVQVSKGGNAKAGNGGNGGNGGNAGNVNNTGNVGGPGPVVIPADLTPAEADCIIAATLGGIFAGGVAPAGFAVFLGPAGPVGGCLADPVPALEDCLTAGVLTGGILTVAEIADCLDALDDPIVVGGGGGGSVFSGPGGAGGAGAAGGTATGGAAAANTNTSTVTVTETETDNSIDVD